VDLKKSPDLGMGIVTGAVFITVSGGKIKGHHGIASFARHEVGIYPLGEGEYTVMQDRAKPVTVASSDNGVYMSLLPPGYYLMKEGSRERTFQLKAKEVKIFNIRKSWILAD